MDPYQTIYYIFGLSLVIWTTLTECKGIHELMTDDEILNVFRSTRDSVPKYEVVSIEHSLHKRSIPKGFQMKFKAFDKDVDIYLNPNDGVLVGEDTPVWVAQHLSNRLHYRRLKKGIMKEVLGVYQSVPGRAALVVRDREDQNMIFDGTVEDMTVTPVPNRFRNMTINKKIILQQRLTSGEGGFTRVMRNTEYHIVFKPNEDIHQTSTAEHSNITAVDSHKEVSNKIEPARSKRSNKDVVFPTILVTTDFNLPVKSDDDSEYYDQIMYQLAFWNGVDLRYRRLSNPSVRLRIAGFVIGSNREATPYLKKHMLDEDIDVYEAIKDMRIHWNQESIKDDILSTGYHIVATATNLKLISKDSSGIKSTYGGLARLGSLCLSGIDKFYPSLIFSDNLNFGGVYAAVHELAHVMGAGHDSETEEECKQGHGYIMSPILSKTPNNPRWSKCSLETLSTFLRNRDCVKEPRNEHPPGKPVAKILPGTLKTAEEQCRARGFDWACETTPGICKTLRCWNSGFISFIYTFNMCQDSWSAAEGTECAPNQVCLDGECRSMYPPESPLKSLNRVIKLLVGAHGEKSNAQIFVPELNRFVANIEETETN